MKNISEILSTKISKKMKLSPTLHQDSNIMKYVNTSLHFSIQVNLITYPIIITNFMNYVNFEYLLKICAYNEKNKNICKKKLNKRT